MSVEITGRARAEAQNAGMDDLTAAPTTLPPALLSVVRSAFGLRAETATPVSGGFDPAAMLWRIVDGDGLGWAVKATSRDCRYGLSLASTLSGDGIAGVVAPRLTRDRLPWTTAGRSLVSVSRWIDGDDAVSSGLDAIQWREFGTTLRAVHDHRPPRNVTPVRRGIKRVGQNGADRLRQLERHFATLTRAEDVSDLAELWQEHRSRFVRLERTARQLKAVRIPAPRVPCHGDPHLGNVLLDGRGHPWLIDLDEATTAHREIDLMLVELGVLPGRPIQPSDREAFWSGYGAVELDEARLIRFGCVRAVEDVTSVFHSLVRPGTVDAAALRDTLQDLLGPLGLIALVEERLGGIAEGVSRRRIPNRV